MHVPFKRKLIATLFMPAMALSVAAHGADDKASNNASRSTAATAPANTATTDARRTASDARQATQSTGEMRASKLIGSDVRNPQGENLGDIKDLIVDVSNEKVHYAVLSFGGFLGLGDKLVAFPVGAFQRAAGDDDKLVLNVDKDRLKQAPGFKSNEYPDFNQPKYRGEVDNFFGPDLAVKPMPNQTLVRASELIGKDIDDRNGKDVGEIEDVVVDMSSGNIRYAVVEFDESWSMDDKLLTVPLKSFTFARDRDEDLVWDIDKSRVENAATFDKNRWPDLNDPGYRANVERNLSTFQPTSGATAGTMAAGSTAAAAAGKPDNTNAVTSSNAGPGSTAAGASANSRTAPATGTTGRAANNSGSDTSNARASTGATGTAPGNDATTFQRLDSNRDNRLSREEIGKDAGLQGQWNQLDRNNDGNVSRSEFQQGGMKK